MWVVSFKKEFFVIPALLFLYQPIARAELSSVSDLSQQLIELRKRIAEQAESVRSKRKTLDEIERQAKLESSQLEMKVAAAETRVKELSQRISQSKVSDQNSQSDNRKHIKAATEDLALLRSSIEKLPPIQREQRLIAVAEIEKQLSESQPRPMKIYNDIIRLLADEHDLGSAVGFQRQVIDLNGVSTPAMLFHVGYSMIVFQTIDSQVGYYEMTPEGTFTARLVDDPSSRDEIENVLRRAQQGLPISEAILPLSMAQEELKLALQEAQQ